MSSPTNEMSTSAISKNDTSSASNDPLQQKVLALTFNQDFTALTMGTEKGYYLFAINPKNKTDETHNFSIEPIKTVKYIPFEEVYIVERVFSSSLLAIVTKQEPRQINLYDVRRGEEIYANKFPTNILAIKMNLSRIVVCLEETIWIFDKLSMKTLHTIGDIKLNSNGPCALSSNNDNPYLAYPAPTNGNIQIFDTVKLEKGLTIIAHNGPVVALAFDMSGTKIATASDKGTVIRIYNAVDGLRLFELRRGALRAATIYSLAFSPDSMFLAASSNTGTIHIFRLMAPTNSGEPVSWLGTFGRILGSPVYLLQQTSEVWTQDRSFATVHLKSGAMKTTIAMNFLNQKLILFVAGYDAVISAYEVNITDGGECPQIYSQYLLSNLSVMGQSITSKPEQNAADKVEGIYPPNLVQNDTKAILNASESANNDTS